MYQTHWELCFVHEFPEYTQSGLLENEVRPGVVLQFNIPQLCIIILISTCSICFTVNGIVDVELLN